jgi:hypothetical protein
MITGIFSFLFSVLEIQSAAMPHSKYFLAQFDSRQRSRTARTTASEATFTTTAHYSVTDEIYNSLYASGKQDKPVPGFQVAQRGYDESGFSFILAPHLSFAKAYPYAYSISYARPP